MSTSFVHLRVHSEFSLVDGIVRIKPLAKRVAGLGMPSVALTDISNFYGLVKFHKAAYASGLKPIYGADFDIGEPGDAVGRLCLLVRNEQGYRNIVQLISRGWQEGQHQGRAYIRREWLDQHSEGIIALSGGKDGDIGHALLGGKAAVAEQLLAGWMQTFPGAFYLELQRTGRENEEDYLHKAVALAEQAGCPVVATNDVRFLDAAEFEAHETRVCINHGRSLDDPRRPRTYSEQQYLRSPEEMAELFSDIPEALANTVEIARRCSFQLQLGTYYLPDFPIPAGKTLETYFREISHQGLDERLAFLFDTESTEFAAKQQEYRERLDFELNVIIQMGFPGYFLIVMDFIQWAKDHGIPVGPGRGSGAGSLVAYSLKITDLDPLQYDLLFERFLNPERVSMPDFDVDFCMEGRDRVIRYVAETYGKEAVSQIITFGTMAAKAVVRDVARVQGKSYGLADRLSKMIPFEVGMSLTKAREQEPELDTFLTDDEEAAEIWEMALKLEGITRGVGKHAGGVVIAPSKLTDFAPLYCDDTGGGLVTQYDKNDVEDVGLVKFDFLGLRTLTIIDWALDTINRKRETEGEAALDIMSIPLDDQSTFRLLKNADTTAVFQLESRGMKELITRLLPDSFEDIIALVALFRPGPLQSGMVDDFINRKHGRAEMAYPDSRYQHECLKPILEPTYGIILYQEQVMQIAQEMAGYSLGGADMLRRAMGKKKPEEMAKQRELFTTGAIDKGFDPDLASNIFDLMEKFAGYGFNKSHSAAYALVSYQTGWLKTHYPAAFMAAVMSSELDNTDKIVVFIEECRQMKLTLNLPDVNDGDYMFTVNDANEIVYGLGAIKGLGEGPVENLLQARSEGGPFANLFDFCARTDKHKMNRRAVEALIRAGAFDRLGEDREVLLASLEEALRAAEQTGRNQASGIDDLFGGSLDVVERDVYEDYRGVRRWSGRERLDGEKQTLGLFLTGHPIEDYEHELPRLCRHRLNTVKPDRGEQRIIGLIVELRVMRNKRGDPMAFVTLDDRTARMEVALFGDAYEQARPFLQADAIVVAEGIVGRSDRDGSITMRGRRMTDLTGARAESLKAVRVSLAREQIDAQFLRRLQSGIERGEDSGCALQIRYCREQCAVLLQLPDSWQLRPSDDALQRLRELAGEDNVELCWD